MKKIDTRFLMKITGMQIMEYEEREALKRKGWDIWLDKNNTAIQRCIGATAVMHSHWQRSVESNGKTPWCTEYAGHWLFSMRGKLLSERQDKAAIAAMVSMERGWGIPEKPAMSVGCTYWPRS